MSKAEQVFKRLLSDREKAHQTRWRIADRLEFVDFNGCYTWPGAKDSFGHGVIKVDGQPLGVHRVVWALANGGIPESGRVVRHVCPGGANPCCANPAHLAEGTQKENVHDACADGRRKRYQVDPRILDHLAGRYKVYTGEMARVARKLNIPYRSFKTLVQRHRAALSVTKCVTKENQVLEAEICVNH